MSSVVPPIDGISNDNHGGIVIVFVIAALCFSILFTVLRFGTATQKHLGFGADDAFFLVSLVVAIIQGLTIGLAVYDGLGKHTASMSVAKVTKYFKETYSSRILAVTSMGSAKLSVTFLYERLDFYLSGHMNLIPLSSTGGWILFSIFALVFQCHLPSPWLISSSNCPAGSSLTIAVAVLNCLSDTVLVVYPIPALWTLTLPLSARLTVIGLFSTRIIVCITAVIDVIYSVRIFGSIDPTWNHFTSAITGIVLVNVSLITATVPRLYSFLVKIPAGGADTRLPSFVLLSRLISTNRTGTRAPTNNQKNRITNIPGISDIQENNVSAASSSSAESDGIHKAVRVEYIPSRGKGKG